MSAKLLKLRLQFFANLNKEEDKDNGPKPVDPNVKGPGITSINPTVTTNNPYTSSIMGATSTPSGSPSTGIVSSAGTTADPENNTDTVTESEDGIVADTVTDTNTFVAAPAPTFETISEKDYYQMYGLDPDRDYQNTVNTLNYEYQTSMATYGQRAEQLYQMGLSNSGVSDIFQANAFSTYLGNMNTAAANRINAKKQNKAAYLAYVKGEKDKFDQERETKLATATSYALENYNGFNLNDVKSMLAASGYDQSIIDQVEQRIGALSADQYQGATALSLAETIFTLMPNYSGSAEDQETLKTMLGSAVNADALTAAINIANAKVQASPEAQAAKVQGLVDTWYESFDANKDMDAFISEVMGVDTTNKESQEYKNAVTAWEQMGATFEGKIKKAIPYLAGLPAGSKDETIRVILENNDMVVNDTELEAIKERFDANNQIVKEEEDNQTEIAVYDELGKVEDGLDNTKNTSGMLTYADYMGAINSVTSIEGEYIQTDNSKDKKDGYRVNAVNMVKYFLAGNNGYELADADKYLVGFLSNDDISNWGKMSDDDRRKTIIEAAISKGTDEIHVDEVHELVSSYVDWKIGDILDYDKNNSGETGLADAGGLVSYIKGLGLKSDKEKAFIGAVVDKMSFTLERNSLLSIDQIKWGDNAEATVHFAVADTASYEKDETIIGALNENKIGDLSYYGGKVYCRKPKNGEYVWRECTEDMLYIYGDWRTNTDEQRAGIYEILVAMLNSK